MIRGGYQMNNQIFSNYMQKINQQEEFMSILLDINDDILAILKIHLLCEHLIEAWICSKTNQENLFVEPVKINMNFSTKLKLARNLSLEKEIYLLFSKINTIRNKFAHNLSQTVISNNDIEDMKNIISNNTLFTSASTMSFQRSDKEEKYNIENDSTPNRIKLCIFYFSIILSIGEKKTTSENTKMVTVSVTLRS
jgi:hypothetical protein